MKKEIKNTRILEKTVRPDKAQILNQVQDDMVVQGDMKVYGHCERMRSNPADYLARSADKNLSPLTSHFSPKDTLTFHLSQRCAFTLAEVLITLGIIGVVAAMTMPSLIQKYQEKETVVKLKKFYSTISQAYQRAIIDNGTPDNWGLQTNNSKNMITALEPYIKFDKICDVGQKCHSASHIYWKTGTETYNYFFNTTTAERYSARLTDGTIIGTLVLSPDCSSTIGTSKQLKASCGEYVVDINGNKGPNVYGTDIFIFELTKYGIIPRGTSDSIVDDYSFEKGCLIKQGWGCAAWVIYNENMDYLHCDDLSWDGKHKCSD